MVEKGLKSFAGKHVLLLQGPLGPFFKRLSKDFIKQGARVSHINFNGGDWLFYPGHAVAYRGRMEEWPEYFSRILIEWQIDVVLMFGDCRPVHACVRERAERLGIEVGVFEAGYVRPSYITLERSGLNDFSQLPRSAEFYRTLPPKDVDVPRPVGQVFWHAALWAILYYVACSLLRPLFPHYEHHRRLSTREAFPWIRGLWRKFYYNWAERGTWRRLQSEFSGRCFLVPVQVHHDSQMHVHSDYADVDTFIQYVVADFAEHAPGDSVLVIKHHPMDRAYRDYTKLCAALAEIYRVEGRLLYVHDVHLPTLYKHVRGVIVVNSTVGLSALLAGVPVKVCGRANYDIPGITYAGLLSEFWHAAPSHRPDRKALAGFHSYLIDTTQINGNVFKRLPNTGFYSGVVWNVGAKPARVPVAMKERALEPLMDDINVAQEA